MRTFNHTLLCAVILLGMSCKAPIPRAPAPLAEFGTPGSDKICVTIFGDVQHPGKYWVTSSSTLESIEGVFGGGAVMGTSAVLRPCG